MLRAVARRVPVTINIRAVIGPHCLAAVGGRLQVPFTSLPGACLRQRISSRLLPIVCVVVCVLRLSVLGEFSGKYNTFSHLDVFGHAYIDSTFFFDEIAINLWRFSVRTSAAAADSRLTDAAAGMKGSDKLWSLTLFW